MSNKNGSGRTKSAASLERAGTSKTPRVDFRIPTQNKFSSLSTNDDKPVDKKPRAPPPITVTDNLTTQFKTVLTDLKVKYSLKIISVGTKIFVETEDEFQSVCKKLDELKIQYFSHPTGNNKIFKLMLCGLPEFPVNEITDHLKSKNNISVKKIVMLNSTNTFRRYILQFDPKENTKSDIKNIKSVLNHIVKWLPAKPSNRGPTQCLYCGMFGHGISSCHRVPTCFLCGEKHETKNCNFKSDDTDQRVFKCFNCKQRNLPHNHKASDPLCPVRIKYIEIKSNASKKGVNNNYKVQYEHSVNAFPPLPAHAPPPLTRTFADTAKQQQYRPTYAQNTRSKFINQNNNINSNNESDLFTFAEISEIMLNCVNDLARCKNKIDQLRVIANLLNHAFK